MSPPKDSTMGGYQYRISSDPIRVTKLPAEIKKTILFVFLKPPNQTCWPLWIYGKQTMKTSEHTKIVFVISLLTVRRKLFSAITSYHEDIYKLLSLYHFFVCYNT